MEAEERMAQPATSSACIVTGGSGFIGTHLLATLVASGRYREIHVVDLVPPRFEHESVIYHRCDIRESVALDLERPGATCYHLAAVCKEPGFAWDEYFRTNHRGTTNVCEFASRCGVANLIYTSTEMVYRAGDREMREEDVTAPDTGYGMSKLLGELEVERWAAAEPGRRCRIARMGVVFGKGENGNLTRLYHALKRRAFFYIGRKTTVKSCVYVKDVVRFLEVLTDDAGDRTVYNLGYRVPTTIADVCEGMCGTFGFRRRILTVPYRLALVAAYVFEGLNNARLLRTSVHHRRIQKLYFSTHLSCEALDELGFVPEFTLPEALADWRSDCDGGDLV